MSRKLSENWTGGRSADGESSISIKFCHPATLPATITPQYKLPSESKCSHSPRRAVCCLLYLMMLIYNFYLHNNITTFISYKVDWRLEVYKTSFQKEGSKGGGQKSYLFHYYFDIFFIDHVKSLLAADRRRSSLSFTITEPTLSAEMSSDWDWQL